MTRVNLVPPQELYDQHLMAEYREIPMVNASLVRSLNAAKGNPSRLKIPPRFTLNSGHVSFFYNKGKWLKNRLDIVYEELIRRRFNVDISQRQIDWWMFERNGLWETTWAPEHHDIEVSRERINLRVSQKPNWYRKTKVE